MEDDGMMHHAIDNRGGDNGISQVIAKVFKIDVRCQKCGTFAVAAVDDLEEQRGIWGVPLLQPVKA